MLTSRPENHWVISTTDPGTGLFAAAVFVSNLHLTTLNVLVLAQEGYKAKLVSPDCNSELKPVTVNTPYCSNGLLSTPAGIVIVLDVPNPLFSTKTASELFVTSLFELNSKPSTKGAGPK